MQVILLKDVKKVGKKGETVKVSDGYGNNYLIKNNLAVLATKTSRKIADEEKEAEKERQAELKKEAEALKERIEKITLEFKLKSGKEGRTFGSISTKNVCEEMQKTHGIKLDKRKFIDAYPASGLGYTKYKVELFKGVIATVTIHCSEK